MLCVHIVEPHYTKCTQCCRLDDGLVYCVAYALGLALPMLCYTNACPSNSFMSAARLGGWAENSGRWKNRAGTMYWPIIRVGRARLQNG